MRAGNSAVRHTAAVAKGGASSAPAKIPVVLTRPQSLPRAYFLTPAELRPSQASLKLQLLQTCVRCSAPCAATTPSRGSTPAHLQHFYVTPARRPPPANPRFLRGLRRSCTAARKYRRD